MFNIDTCSLIMAHRRPIHLAALCVQQVLNGFNHFEANCLQTSTLRCAGVTSGVDEAFMFEVALVASTVLPPTAESYAPSLRTCPSRLGLSARVPRVPISPALARVAATVGSPNGSEHTSPRPSLKDLLGTDQRGRTFPIKARPFKWNQTDADA